MPTGHHLDSLRRVQQRLWAISEDTTEKQLFRPTQTGWSTTMPLTRSGVDHRDTRQKDRLYLYVMTTPERLREVGLNNHCRTEPKYPGIYTMFGPCRARVPVGLRGGAERLETISFASLKSYVTTQPGY